MIQGGFFDWWSERGTFRVGSEVIQGGFFDWWSERGTDRGGVAYPQYQLGPDEGCIQGLGFP